MFAAPSVLDAKAGSSDRVQYTSVPSNENAPVFVARLAVPLNRADPDAAEKRPVPPTNVIVPENATCAGPAPGITSPIVVWLSASPLAEVRVEQLRSWVTTG